MSEFRNFLDRIIEDVRLGHDRSVEEFLIRNGWTSESAAASVRFIRLEIVESRHAQHGQQVDREPTNEARI